MCLARESNEVQWYAHGWCALHLYAVQCRVGKCIFMHPSLPASHMSMAQLCIWGFFIGALRGSFRPCIAHTSSKYIWLYTQFFNTHVYSYHTILGEFTEFSKRGRFLWFSTNLCADLCFAMYYILGIIVYLSFCTFCCVFRPQFVCVCILHVTVYCIVFEYLNFVVFFVIVVFMHPCVLMCVFCTWTFYRIVFRYLCVFCNFTLYCIVFGHPDLRQFPPILRHFLHSRRHCIACPYNPHRGHLLEGIWHCIAFAIALTYNSRRGHLTLPCDAIARIALPITCTYSLYSAGGIAVHCMSLHIAWCCRGLVAMHCMVLRCVALTQFAE